MNIKWNADEYQNKFGFVHQYGEDVLDLIDSEKNKLVVDLGCGNGALSKKLLDRGYRVLGIDASEDMLRIAQKQYPEIEFQLADAQNFKIAEKADVIFSNAVLHWIDADQQEKLIQNIFNQLKPGGQFVCEFGGKGCAEKIHSTLEKNFLKYQLPYPRTFYFPTIGEYTPILEKCGFQVEYAVLFDRPTEQNSKDGLVDWIRMFITAPFEGISEEMAEVILSQTVKELESTLYHDGKWYVDYVRLRFKAKKIL